jgi:hypothetical protein
MSSRDIYEAVAAIMHPMPDRDDFAAANEHLPADDLSLIFDEVWTTAHQEREANLADLRDNAEHSAEHDEEYDPLLDQIRNCREQMLAAEHRMRLLVAYAREFVRPQPYQLRELAHAAGLSISGVRIAYDLDEVEEVAQRTGDKPRRAWAETEQ